MTVEAGELVVEELRGAGFDGTCCVAHAGANLNSLPAAKLFDSARAVCRYLTVF